MRFAEVFLWIAGAYIAVGALWASLFCIAFVQRIDPNAEGASKMFRAIIWPGVCLLWPLTLMWVWRSRGKAAA